MKDAQRETGIPFSAGAVLISVGVVYGDIGTSPMYVMKSILEGNGGITGTGEDVIYGALSLVIWTIILLTTVKYVLIAMQADNHNEGGIFALYSLVKKCGKWLVFPAMIGGAALLADGILTPAVTVTTAIEGLRSIPWVYKVLGNDQDKIVVITLVIIAALFLVQKAGTSSIGRAFGPVMTLWFLFLAAAGCFHIMGDPGILRALNPLWAVKILVSPDNRMGLMILGSVFLATTGAEALYSDMGHVGRQNIYASWPFVKMCLILNYLGQGAWLLKNRSSGSLGAIPDMNPFFEMLPEEIRPLGVVLGTMAAVIASQALVTGSFTLVSEAADWIDASYADRVPIHDQGADLYPTGQSGAVDLLFCAGALFQDQCPYGGGIRSGHYAHYADDDPAFVCLPEQDQEKIQEFLAVSVIFRRAGGDIFPFQSE